MEIELEHKVSAFDNALKKGLGFSNNEVVRLHDELAKVTVSETPIAAQILMAQIEGVNNAIQILSLTQQSSALFHARVATFSAIVAAICSVMALFLGMKNN